MHLVQDESDFEFLTGNPPAPPYAAVVKPKDFTRSNILRLRDSKFISAIVLINDTVGMANFSQELKCPNEFFTHAKQPQCDATKPETVWNPFGSGLLYENFEIPIIFLGDKNETAKVTKCFNDFNTDLKSHAQRSLCSIEVNSFMTGAGNSEICIRRTKGFKMLNDVRYCDPLQGKNVYGTLFPRKIDDSENRTVDTQEKIILVTARLDTTSSFDGVGLGAMDSLAPMATLISAAHYLRKISGDIKNNVNVMFVLFNGESYDFIGSQRFLYDLKKGDVFPSPMTQTNLLNLDNILFMVDIGPLDTFDAISFLSVKEFDVGRKFAEAAQRYNNQLKLKVNFTPKITENFPPVSAQTFLRENASFPAFAVSTEKAENRFYHSVYDNVENLNFTYINTSGDFDSLDKLGSDDFSATSVQVKIRNVATLISLALFDFINNGSYEGKEVASAALVDEFLYCYLVASKCKLFQAIFAFPGEFKGNDFPPQRYVSVQQMMTLEATGWAHRVFGFVLSKPIEDVTKENCTILPQYWMPGSKMTGECRRTTQNFSIALSPAFEEEDYDFKSNKYSTWTESTWNELSARIFLRPSATHESLTFSIGFVVMILSFVAVYIVNTKSDVLFGDIPAEQ